MWRRFELIDAVNVKFWCVKVRREACIIRFGRLGSDGQKRTLVCEDAAAARNKRDQLIRQKLASGYIEVDERKAVAALRDVGAGLDFHKNGRVRSIDLMFKPFSSSLIPYINRATTLEHLNVRGTAFDDADLRNLKPSLQLTGIDLYGTRITNEGVKRLPLFSNLVWLDLSKTAVTDRSIRYLARLTQLRRLSLHETAITDDGIRFIATFRHIAELYLGHNSLSDRCLPHLSKLAKLSILELDATDVSDDGLHHLKHLKSLRGVMLCGTRVTHAGAEQLRSRLVHASVVID